MVAPPLFPVSVEELTNEANYAMRIEKENLTKSPINPLGQRSEEWQNLHSKEQLTVEGYKYND